MDEGARVTVSYANGDTFTNTSPFLIAAEIRRLVGEVEAARPNAKGNLQITTRNRQQTEALLHLTEFLNKEAEFDCPIRLNSVEAYVYAPSLTDVTEEDIITELRDQGVIGVYRLRPSRGKTNPGLRLTIIGKTVPSKIRAGFEDIATRPWKRSPLLCRGCASYGHTIRHCRAAYRRCLRCAGPHGADDCEATGSRCPHCGGGHPAWDRRCPHLQAYFEKQEKPAAPAPARPPSTEATTQTDDTKPETYSRYTECRAPPSTSTTAQTDDLPIFEGPVTFVEAPQEDRNRQQQSAPTESERRWGHRTTAPPSAELPPAAGTRANYKARTQQKQAVFEEHPEMEDPELMPREKRTTRRDEDHQFIFIYKDGSRPTGTVTHLFRFEVAVRVVDLNLRPGTRAFKAACNGFYFDRKEGQRLYLQRPTSPIVELQDSRH